MSYIPTFISIFFMMITGLTVAIFYKATTPSKPTLIILLFWLAFQTVISISGFYIDTDTMPPRVLLLLLPPLLFIVGIFITSKGRHFVDTLNLKSITILHTIRIGVEMILYSLFVYKAVPQLMTYEGRNFDILAGLSAPLIFYFGFIKKQLSRNAILIWNFICLGLLINIVINAILSVPFPLQKFAFDQPNVAVLYFPFNLLPSVVVPIVLLSHLAAIRQLLKMGELKTTLR